MSIQVLRDEYAQYSEKLGVVVLTISETDAALAEIDALESQLAELETRAQVSERREKEGDRLYSRCAAALDRVEAERNAALAKAEELESQLAEANDRLQRANEYAESRESDYDEATDVTEQAIQRAEAAEARVVELEAALQAKTEQADGFWNGVNVASARIVELEAALTDALYAWGLAGPMAHNWARDNTAYLRQYDEAVERIQRARLALTARGEGEDETTRRN